MAKKVIVIGAGASGLMAAGRAAERGYEVLLFDKNAKVGRKLMITGKGRCNLTNYCTDMSELMDNIPQNNRFLYSAFSNFMPSDIMAFYENLGVKLKVERGNRVFPVSDKASDIVDALKKYIDLNRVKFIKSDVKKILTKDQKATGIITKDGEKYLADAVVLASGGLSYPLTGSNGDGYEMAKKLGHHITDLRPSLIGLICTDGWLGDAAGLSLRNISIKITDREKNKKVYEDFGELLITHKGVSGPVILSASAHLKDMKTDKYEISIDLKPALSESKLDDRLLREINKNGQKEIKTVIASLVPSSLINVILKKCGLSGKEKCAVISKEIRKKIALNLKDFRLDVKDFCPIEEAVITRGGIDIKEINPKTMESKIVKDLYFTGEIIDVDGYTGGFNLTIAFATGNLAGISI